MNKQITEDYVSLEIAKLLKEKGFDAKCSAYYISDDEIALLPITRDFNNNGIFLSAPTHQMALKWLREVHKLHIFAKPYWPQGDMRNKMSWQGFIVDLNTMNGDSQCYADSYEEAIEKRIKFALENLI